MLADAGPGMLTDLASELFRRTQGHIGSLTTLIERACDQAIRTGAETITDTLVASVSIDNAATARANAK